MAEAVSGREVNVKLDVSHTWSGDLKIQLEGPTGQQVTLRSRTGGSRNNVIGVYGGDLSPVDKLSQMSTEPAGIWKLKVQDLVPRDIGQINSWEIQLK